MREGNKRQETDRQPKEERLNIRLPREVYENLLGFANADMLPVSSFARLILGRGLAAWVAERKGRSADKPRPDDKGDVRSPSKRRGE